MTRDDYKAASDALCKIDAAIENIVRDLVEAEQSAEGENAKRIYAATLLLGSARRIVRETDGVLSRTLVTNQS